MADLAPYHPAMQTHPRMAWLFALLLLSTLAGAAACTSAAQNTGRTLTDGAPHEYIIGSGDVLEILVWKNADLSKTVTVRPDGKISLPLINDIQAAGSTPMELKEQIAQELRKFKEVPEVSVIVTDAKSRVVYVLGQVVRPGAYPLGPNATVIQVIALSGGFRTVPRYRRADLRPGDALEGPLVVEEPSTRLPIDAGDRLRVDVDRNLIVEVRR